MDLMARVHLRHISRAKLCMALVAMLACLVSLMDHYYSTMVLTRLTEVTNWFFQCAILSPSLEEHVSCWGPYSLLRNCHKKAWGLDVGGFLFWRRFRITHPLIDSLKYVKSAKASTDVPTTVIIPQVSWPSPFHLCFRCRSLFRNVADGWMVHFLRQYMQRSSFSVFGPPARIFSAKLSSR